MAKPQDRLLSPLAQQFRTVAQYTAWIDAKGWTERGASAMALRVRPNDGNEREFNYSAASPGPGSSLWRAAVQAVLRVVEVLPSNSSVSIRARSLPIVNGINDYLLEWQKQSFAREGGKRRPAAEKWEAIARLCDEKNISVRAVHVPRNQTEEDDDAETFAKLEVAARQEYEIL